MHRTLKFAGITGSLAAATLLVGISLAAAIESQPRRYSFDYADTSFSQNGWIVAFAATKLPTGIVEGVLTFIDPNGQVLTPSPTFCGPEESVVVTKVFGLSLSGTALIGWRCLDLIKDKNGIESEHIVRFDPNTGIEVRVYDSIGVGDESVSAAISQDAAVSVARTATQNNESRKLEVVEFSPLDDQPKTLGSIDILAPSHHIVLDVQVSRSNAGQTLVTYGYFPYSYFPRPTYISKLFTPGSSTATEIHRSGYAASLLPSGVLMFLSQSTSQKHFRNLILVNTKNKDEQRLSFKGRTIILTSVPGTDKVITFINTTKRRLNSVIYDFTTGEAQRITCRGVTAPQEQPPFLTGLMSDGAFILSSTTHSGLHIVMYVAQGKPGNKVPFACTAKMIDARLVVTRVRSPDI